MKSRFRGPSPLFSVLLLSALLALGGCDAPKSAPVPGTEPLLDARWPADILAERRRLEAASPIAGHRLLTGWRIEEMDGALRIEPEPGGGRFEIVSLEKRPRRLVLDLTAAEASEVESSTSHARLFLGERLLVSQEIDPQADEVELQLPADLPLGRVTLRLELSPPRALWLHGSGLRSALPAGRVEIGPDVILQGGASMVDIVRPVPAGSVLKGRLDLKEAEGLRVHISVESEARIEMQVLQRRVLNRFLDTKIEFPLGEGAGLRRIRFAVQGGGGAGQVGWHDLRIEHGEDGSPSPEFGSDPVPTSVKEDVPEPPPVVVFYVLDALRADSLGHLGGDPSHSPTIDRLASEGVTFLDHQSVAPNTTASTKSLFTGRYFPLLGEKKLPEDGPATLAELFAEAGYRTGAFSGNGNISEPLGNIRGFEILARAPTGQPGKSARAYNDDAERVHGAALEWLDSLTPSEKIFLYLHTVHPHSPYDPPEPFRSRFVTETESSVDGARMTLKRLTEGGPSAATEADRRRLRQLYLAGLAYNDAHLATFLDEIRGRLAGRDLLLILTSDHGEELYEHGGILHGFTLYREMLQVPLIFWWPGQLEARRVDALTDNVDLHETLRAMLRLEAADGLGEARSLWPLLRASESSSAERVRFGIKSGRGVTYHMAESRLFKLIWAPADGRIPGMGRGGARAFDLEHVYDLISDPGEKTNLAGDQRLEVAWLRTRLRGFIARGSRLEVGEEVGDFDEETLQILRALGYVD